MKIKQTVLAVSVIGALLLGSVVYAKHFTDWTVPVSSEINNPQDNGCASESPDGLAIYFSSNRPVGGTGGLDIWIARRESKEDSWGEAHNLGAAINTTADDYCPRPVRGGGMFFVTSSARAGSCGGPDLYFTRESRGEWSEPQNLGCEINSPAAEWAPSYFEGEDGQQYLYFSSTRPGGFDQDPGPTGDMDIYVSTNFGPPELAPGLNTSFTDARPSVRKDGLEIFFDTNRPVSLGINDIWTATRESIDDDWSLLIHLDSPINSPAQEASPSLSWDGERLYFNSYRVGGGSGITSAVYVTARAKFNGNE